MRALLAALALAPLHEALATDLVNKDNVSYRFSVISPDKSATGEIPAKSAKIGVCASTAAKCVVAVDGVGEIEVTGADDVVVQNGRLSKQ